MNAYIQVLEVLQNMLGQPMGPGDTVPLQGESAIEASRLEAQAGTPLAIPAVLC